jgi:hypothetical protein
MATDLHFRLATLCSVSRRFSSSCVTPQANIPRCDGRIWRHARLVRATLAQVDAELMVSLGALLVAGIALYFTGMAARATKAQADAVTEQIELQRQMHRDAAQPYVWVDLRPDSKQSSLLILVVGNSGHTVATNVRATFDPPFGLGSQGAVKWSASKLLSEGIPSLSPGRQIVWVLGAENAILGTESALRVTITVDAEGPSGPLPQLRYDVDVHTYRGAHDSPDGSLHLVRMAIEQVATVIARENGTSRP